MRNVLKINNYTANKIGLLSLIIVVLSSCVGVKQAGGNSGPSNKLYEIFYLEDGILQYFIKPQSLLYNSSDEHSFDLLFRKKDNTSDSLVINLTAYTPKALTNNTKASITGNGTTALGNDFTIIYSEKSGDDFKNRLSFKISYRTFLKIIENNSFNIALETPEMTDIKLSTSKRTNKNIEQLKGVFLY